MCGSTISAISFLNSKDTTTELYQECYKSFETRKQMCSVLYLEVYEADCGNEISFCCVIQLTYMYACIAQATS